MDDLKSPLTLRFVLEPAMSARWQHSGPARRRPRIPRNRASKLPIDSTRLADERTSLALDRTLLADERTLMAWVRTAVSLISFGFAIYKFFQYLREGEQVPPTHTLLGPRVFALAMISLGLVALLLASVEHGHQMDALQARFSQYGTAAALDRTGSCLDCDDARDHRADSRRATAVTAIAASLVMDTAPLGGQHTLPRMKRSSTLAIATLCSMLLVPGLFAQTPKADLAWPRTYSVTGGTALLYQPQVERWTDRKS